MAKKLKHDAKVKEEAKKFLAKVPEECVFWCHDGRIFRDMQELAEALGNMTDETFAYHSNGEKKDFSQWVGDIIGDAKLAKDLENVLDRNQAAGFVVDRITILTQTSA